MVDFTPEQSDAIERGVRYFDNFEFNRQEVFRLFGAAGTGKTTLAKEIAKRTGRRVMFMAFTGKAAMVLTVKGAPASTIHKGIFIPRGSATAAYQEELSRYDEMQDGPEKHELGRKLDGQKKALNQPVFVPKDISEFPRDTAFALDEVSMVDKFIGESLLHYGFPVLAMGDPYQLKPVAGEGFFTNAKPDVLLKAIHRQAAGNPVLRLATAIRPKAGGGGGRALDLPYGSLGSSRIVRSMRPEEYAEYDQVLCGTNKTRIMANAAFRRMQKRTKVLEPGEKIIVLQNNYELSNVLNGSMWRVEACRFEEKGPHKYYRCNLSSLDMPGETLRNVQVHVMPLLEGTPQFQKFWLPAMTGNKDAIVATYGNAITVHKAQGSEWKSVALVDEWSKSDAQYVNWLYTGVTRASERVTIVRKETGA